MKLNIISDIHATIDKKSGKIIYHMPYRFSKNKYFKAVIALKDFFNNHYDKVKTIDISNCGLYAFYPETVLLKSKKQILLFLDKLVKSVENDFKGLTIKKSYDFSRKLNNISEILTINNLTTAWKYKKTKLVMRDIIDYMFKHVCDFDPTKLKSADYLIIAGDLGLDNIYDKVLKDLEKKTKGKFKKILHIAGNHDHWWFSDKDKNKVKPERVNLEHDYCIHEDGDYLFLGCTLWTPLKDYNLYRVGKYMNDYRYSPNFSPIDSNRQYEIQSEWLKNKIETNKDKKIVVFTHHQPFIELIEGDYRHSDVNAAYVVVDHSLDDINKYRNIKLWCCGHTHKNFDGMLHDVHVVRNPIGYSDIYGCIPAENLSESWYNKIIEV